MIEQVSTHKSAKPHEARVLDEGAPEILRCAQDDTTLACHPERSEGSPPDLWILIRIEQE